MVKRHALSGSLLVLALTVGGAAWSQGSQPGRSPDPFSIMSAGKTVGHKSRDAFIATGDFFKKIGVKTGEGTARLFIGQGKFWKRVGHSFADFQEQPTGLPGKLDKP